jgi:hypothetical protein
MIGSAKSLFSHAKKAGNGEDVRVIDIKRPAQQFNG